MVEIFNNTGEESQSVVRGTLMSLQFGQKLYRKSWFNSWSLNRYTQ